MTAMRERIVASALAISGAALISLALHEGYRSTAYDDGVGVQTIGFGETKNVRRGDTTTVERALVRLGASVSEHEARLRDCIGDVPLYQGEWDAYVSWTYNVGTSAACGSSLVKKLRSSPPDYVGACAELLRWTRAGGRELQGLVTRRKAEFKQCIEAGK